MQVTMHAVFDNQQELAKFADLLAKSDLNIKTPNQPAAAVAPVATATSTKDKAPTTNQKLAQKAEAEAKTENAAPEKTGKEPAPASDKKQSPLDPNYENMKNAVLLVNRTLGREPTETLLKKYEGQKNGKWVVGPHIPEKYYAEIIAECNKLLAAK